MQGLFLLISLKLVNIGFFGINLWRGLCPLHLLRGGGTLTFLEMQTDALDIIQDWQNHADYTLDKLKHYINLGNKNFVRHTRCIEGNIDITTVANQFEYSQADESDLQYLYKPQQFRYIENATEVGWKLEPFRGGYFNLPKDKIYSRPTYYWIRNVSGRSVTTAGSPTGSAIRTGVRLGTWPIISAVKTLRIEGFLWPITLTADTHTPEYEEAWHDAAVFWAAYRILWLFTEKFPETRKKAIENKQLFDERVAEAKSEMAVNDFSLFGVPDVEEDLGNW
ncbi:hypothetical protein LCGC14_1381880 [marine sediment metagenome]|uniref:Uncharacterized protein n=1 Tax=marine sediment metagenome TaxID=412755 RepID=A0A0F9MHY0_9ZZZZ